MKNKILKAAILFLISISITGCSKSNYQKDKSYEADITGNYEISAKTEEDNEVSYYKQYTLNKDDTYNYKSSVFGTDVESNGDYIINNETQNIIRIDFNIIDSLSNNEETAIINSATQYKKIYKYKNMLGSIIEARDLPTSDTFNYIIPNETAGGMMYTNDGYYHSCADIKNCQCDYAKDTKYIRKDNIIYFNIKDSVNEEYWQIASYIIDGYLFTPEFYKVE